MPIGRTVLCLSQYRTIRHSYWRQVKVTVGESTSFPCAIREQSPQSLSACALSWWCEIVDIRTTGRKITLRPQTCHGLIAPIMLMTRVPTAMHHTHGHIAQRILRLLCGSTMVVAVLQLSPHARATTWQWSGASGLLPTNLTPSMSLFLSGSATAPALTNGALHIVTDVNSDNVGFQQLSPALEFPDVLVIQAQLRVASNSASVSYRAAATINFSTLTNIGCAFFVGNGEIFLTSAENVKGQSASLETTNYHTYRIECLGTNLGSDVNVYRDGVLTISGQTYFSSNDFGNQPRILWGEGSSLAHGTEDWTNFQHNALACMPDTNSLKLGIFETAGQAGLTWPSSLAQSYLVQWSPSLLENSWTNLGTSMQGTGFTNVVYDPAAVNPRRYYRVLDIGCAP